MYICDNALFVSTAIFFFPAKNNCCFVSSRFESDCYFLSLFSPFLSISHPQQICHRVKERRRGRITNEHHRIHSTFRLQFTGFHRTFLMGTHTHTHQRIADVHTAHKTQRRSFTEGFCCCVNSSTGLNVFRGSFLTRMFPFLLFCFTGFLIISCLAELWEMIVIYARSFPSPVFDFLDYLLLLVCSFLAVSFVFFVISNS